MMLGDTNTSDEKWKEALDTVDTDNDGKIDYEEFKKVFKMMVEEKSKL